jgi:hypothetical protein
LWLKPVLVAQVEFVEWTPDGHLWRSRFMRLREDKEPIEYSARLENRDGVVLPSVVLGRRLGNSAFSLTLNTNRRADDALLFR